MSDPESTGKPDAETEQSWRRRRPWVMIAAVLLSVGLLAALLGFGLTRDPRLLASTLVGHRAPNFSLQTIDGDRTIRLSDFRGKVVVLNFWQSTCVECRYEHPHLVTAWERFRRKGAILLGIVYQDTAGNAQAFMRELGGGWPNLMDPGSRTALDYGVFGIPETFFIGRDGIIAYKQIGPSTLGLISTWVNRLLRSGE